MKPHSIRPQWHLISLATDKNHNNVWVIPKLFYLLFIQDFVDMILYKDKSLLFTLILLKNFYQCLVKYISSTLYVGSEIINKKIIFSISKLLSLTLTLQKILQRVSYSKLWMKRNIKDTECWISNKLNKFFYKCYMKNDHKRYLPCLDKNTL